MDVQEGIGLERSTDTSMKWTESAMAEEVFISTLHHSLSPVAAQQDVTQSAHHLEQQLFKIIQTSDTSKTGLLRLTEALGKAFLADSCLVGLKDRNQTIAQNACWYVNGTASFSQKQTIVLDILKHPIIQDRLRGSSTVAITDLQIADASLLVALKTDTKPLSLSAPPQENKQIRAVLVIQTLFQGYVNGVVILTRSQPYQWTDLDVQRLKTSSNLIAIAISQTQLEQQLQQQLRYQSLIEQVTTATRSTLDLNQIFQLSLEGLVSALQVTKGFILLLKYTDPPVKGRTSERLPKAKATVECQYPLACDWPSPPDVKNEPGLDVKPHTGTQLKQTFWVSDCEVLQQIFANKAQPVVIPTLDPTEAQQDQFKLTADGNVAKIFRLEAMPSLLLISLENQGTVLGCLVLQHSQQRFWQPEDLSFVKLIAAQLSTAIIQTQTLRQVQSLVEERTVQLQHSLDVQAKLYDKTRQQVDQLRRLNQIMEEFLSTMSHELLTPLTSMTLAIRMLRQAELSPEQRSRYLEILERQCAQETNLINDLLALQQLESKSAVMRFTPLDIRYLIRDAAKSYEENWAKKELKLDINLPDRPLNIHTDADSLNRILMELLANAGKYADSGTVVRLNVVYQATQQLGQIVLTLSNIGARITPEEMPYIFDKFRRGKGVTQQAIPGTGLGLALVKGLVEHLNGAIVASSVPLDPASSWETCFTLTLPQSPNLSTCI